MGVHKNISATKFPKQGKTAGTPVFLYFNYGPEEFKAKYLRDDIEEPFRTIFQLEDGRVVLATECQYAFVY